MIHILLDTDVLINFSKGYDTIIHKLLNDTFNIELYTNTVIIAEFYADKKLKNPNLANKTQEFLNQFTFLELNAEIGYIAGELLRDKSFHIADTLIAATCIHYNIMLYTQNKKHFDHIPNLKLYNPVL